MYTDLTFEFSVLSICLELRTYVIIYEHCQLSARRFFLLLPLAPSQISQSYTIFLSNNSEHQNVMQMRQKVIQRSGFKLVCMKRARPGLKALSALHW